MASSYSTSFAQVPKIVISDKDGWHKLTIPELILKKIGMQLPFLGQIDFQQ